MSHFSEYIIVKGGGSAKAVFVPGIKLSWGVAISTPFVFPFIDSQRLMLARDKSGWWNPLGGHMEGGETWETALEREAHEEAGVIIDKPILFGSVIVTQSQQPISGYPERTVLPFTWSQVLKIDEGWQPRETLGRRICSISEVRKLFGERNDNHQMEEIFEYLLVNK